MEQNNHPSVKSTSVKYGAINGLIGIILTIIIDVMGLSGDQMVQWVGLLIFIVVVVFAHRDYKNEGDGYMSYSQGLGIGTLVAVISGLISNLFLLVYIHFINDTFLESLKEKSIMDMEAQGMSDAKIDQAMQVMDIFMQPGMIVIIGLVVGVLFGFLASLIVSIFTKKSKPEFH